MNGVHDMGGMQNMGHIERERDEPVFHETWEGRVWAMNRAARAWRKWTIDASRWAIESLPPVEYLRSSYYERWFAALVNLLIQSGLVSEQEVEAGRAADGTEPATPALTVEMARRAPNRGIPSADEPAIAARFNEGQTVRTHNVNPPGHTRLPRYARGKTGTIVRDHGVYTFPDVAAHGLGDKRQHVYSVRFAARELWGEAAYQRDSVHLDLWDDYLERA